MARHPSIRMKTLISGGGIAGLATGIALRSRGIEVEIFERSSGRCVTRRRPDLSTPASVCGA
jgi:2-polyprenyl-6-methoxyphenol hydroxylase-like FAD-dependent oxidoreductase